MDIINIASSGIRAAQAGMGVTSMNIANMLTPGYSRQGILQSAVGPLGQNGLSAGNGVQVDSIRRIASQYLIGQVWQTTSNASYLSVNNDYLSALEKVIGGESTSLGNGLDELFGGLSDLTTQPESDASRQQLLSQASMLAGRFNSINDFINSQKKSISGQRDATVNQINNLSAAIADYNKKIADMTATGGNTSALQDGRDELVRQLSGLADISVSDDGSGSYTVTLKAGQPLVNGQTAGELSLGRDANGNPTLSLAFSNSQFSLSFDTGGELGALSNYENGTLKEMQESVYGMAEALATMFNNQLAQGFDKNGNPGKPLFNFDPTNPAGILQVTDITADELALSGKAGEPGNGDNLLALIGLKDQAVSINGMGTLSLNDAADSLISTIGSISSQNQIELDAALAVRDEAQLQRDNLSAVNQDEEAINLQTYMQAYQANVKVISAGNQLFTDLLGLF